MIFVTLYILLLPVTIKLYEKKEYLKVCVVFIDKSRHYVMDSCAFNCHDVSITVTTTVEVLSAQSKYG